MYSVPILHLYMYMYMYLHVCICVHNQRMWQKLTVSCPLAIQVGRNSLENTLLRYSAKDYFFKASVCRFCIGIEDVRVSACMNLCLCLVHCHFVYIHVHVHVQYNNMYVYIQYINVTCTFTSLYTTYSV